MKCFNGTYQQKIPEQCAQSMLSQNCLYTGTKIIIIVEAWKAKYISTSWTTNEWRFCTRTRCSEKIRWKANLIDIYEDVSFVPKCRSTPRVSDYITKYRRRYFNSIFVELYYEIALLIVNTVAVFNYFRETFFSTQNC